MTEYLDKEAYCREYCNCNSEYCDKAACPIFSFPAADVAPVVHGEWEVVDLLTLEHDEVERVPKSALRCSVCSYAIDKGLLWAANFCPHCGAKMDSGSDN